MLCIFIMICVCTNHIIFIAIAYYLYEAFNKEWKWIKKNNDEGNFVSIIQFFFSLLSLKGTKD